MVIFISIQSVMTKLVFSPDLYPLILLPDECMCTEYRQGLVTDCRPSSLSGYINTGILNAFNYHSYISTNICAVQDYFAIMSQPAFEIAYV